MSARTTRPKFLRESSVTPLPSSEPTFGSIAFSLLPLTHEQLRQAFPGRTSHHRLDAVFRRPECSLAYTPETGHCQSRFISKAQEVVPLFPTLIFPSPTPSPASPPSMYHRHLRRHCIAITDSPPTFHLPSATCQTATQHPPLYPALGAAPTRTPHPMHRCSTSLHSADTIRFA